jgi:hypothetical protein
MRHRTVQDGCARALAKTDRFDEKLVILKSSRSGWRPSILMSMNRPILTDYPLAR